MWGAGAWIKRTFTVLLDDFVGAAQDQLRDRQPLRLGRLQVDDQLEPGWLLDGDVDRFGAAQKADQLAALDLSIELNDARPIADQATFARHFRPLVDGGHTERRQSFEDNRPIVVEEL